MKILKQSIFAFLISSALAFNGLAQSAKFSSYLFQDKKPSEKPKEKEKEREKEPKERGKEPREKPRDDKRDDKKKP